MARSDGDALAPGRDSGNIGDTRNVMAFKFLRFRGTDIGDARTLGIVLSEELEKIQNERGCTLADAMRRLSMKPDGKTLIDRWLKDGAAAPPEPSR